MDEARRANAKKKKWEKHAKWERKKNERSEKVHTIIKRKRKWKFPHICPAVGQKEGIPICSSCDVWM